MEQQENQPIQEVQKEEQPDADAKTEDKPKKRFNPFLIIIPVVVVIILGSIGYFLFSDTINKSLNPPKVYHVGILSCYDFSKQISDGFKQGLKDLGYVEGKNITYDIQVCKSENEAVTKPILQKFINDKVDLIVALPTQAAITAKQIAGQAGIPIVFGIADTEGNSLIESVRHPGGNVTGVRLQSGVELDLGTLGIYHKMAPNVKRLWMPYSKDDPSSQAQIVALRPAVAAMGINLVELPVSSAQDVLADLNARDKLQNPGIDGIMTIAEPLFGPTEITKAMGNFAEKHNIPVAYGDDSHSIFTLAPDIFKSGQMAATLVDKIFKGTPAGNIPVVTAGNRFVINYKVTTKLGLAIPDSLLSQADKIIR